jgi:hypothetical protein
MYILHRNMFCTTTPNEDNYDDEYKNQCVMYIILLFFVLYTLLYA